MPSRGGRCSGRRQRAPGMAAWDRGEKRQDDPVRPRTGDGLPSTPRVRLLACVAGLARQAYPAQPCPFGGEGWPTVSRLPAAARLAGKVKLPLWRLRVYQTTFQFLPTGSDSAHLTRAGPMELLAPTWYFAKRRLASPSRGGGAWCRLWAAEEVPPPGVTCTRPRRGS